VVKKIVSFVIVFLLIANCATAGEIPSEFRQKNSPYKHPVHFYGSPYCGHCLHFSRNMQKEGIPFIFHNVKASDKANEEMWNLVHSVDSGANSVRFPVLNVNGKVLVSPEYKELKKELFRLK